MDPSAESTPPLHDQSPDIDNDDDPVERDPEKHARRREQVRRAQKAHRDRKASYVKTLEAEVTRLRARDATHYADVAAFQETIRQLKDLLRKHNIPIPHDLTSDASPGPGAQARVELFALPDQTQSIRAELPAEYTLQELANLSTFSDALAAPAALAVGAPVAPSLATTTSSDLFSGLTISDAPSFAAAGAGGAESSNVTTMPIFHPQGLGTTQTGVDFVLALEYLCLEHNALHSVHEECSGHHMMLMSPIMNYSPPLTQTTQLGSGLPDGATWNVPAIELERLLECSYRLSLDGEITPVEVWRRIREHPNFLLLSREGLKALKDQLVPEVFCYGFGAVIKEERFESLLGQALGFR